MTLSITGPSVFIGESLVPGGIEFLPTDMDAVDASGNPTGEKLLIAKTPLINAHRNRINAYLLARGETHGSMAMHEDGTAYVVGRGTETDPQRVCRTPVMDPRHNAGTVISVKHDIQFYSDIMYDGPDFATDPAVYITWYESASQAAAIEDAHKRATGQDVRVRMIRDPEYTRFVTWGGKYTEKQVKARAYLYCHGSSQTVVSVVGNAATSRTTPEGFVDVFGNVLIWTDNSIPRSATDDDLDMDAVARLLRSASWFCIPQDVRVGLRNASGPNYNVDFLGVRWVAVSAAPASGMASGGKLESTPQKGFGPIEF